MHGNLPITGAGAINADGSFDVQGTAHVKSDVDDENWFSEAAKRLYTQKPGTILFLLTALADERQCQKYAAGHVKPPAYFLRALLRSEHGWQWLSAAMSGSDTQWWADVQRARSIKEAIDKIE